MKYAKKKDDQGGSGQDHSIDADDSDQRPETGDQDRIEKI